MKISGLFVIGCVAMAACGPSACSETNAPPPQDTCTPQGGQCSDVSCTRDTMQILDTSCGMNRFCCVPSTPVSGDCQTNGADCVPTANCRTDRTLPLACTGAGIVCCIPSDVIGPDASADASRSDGPTESAASDAPVFGTCAGRQCPVDWKCAPVPPGDAGSDGGPTGECVPFGGGGDAGAISCGAIECIDGCTCPDPSASACVCP